MGWQTDQRSKEPKIKRTEIINDFAGGGLKMLDLQCFNRALKAKWFNGI